MFEDVTSACCVCSTPRCAAFHMGRGPFASDAHSPKCRERATSESSHRDSCEVKMGLEKEKYETSIIMDEDEFNRSIEPILSKKEKFCTPTTDRDPNDINAHLKVR